MGVDQTENESRSRWPRTFNGFSSNVGHVCSQSFLSNRVLVLDIVSERNDKVLRIEYSERGERVEKLVRASNAKITYTDY